jgi:hypothetical protein
VLLAAAELSVSLSLGGAFQALAIIQEASIHLMI